MDPITELKTRAELLHRAIEAGDEAAIARLRALPEHRRADADALVQRARDVQRKHCLAIVARELGFESWEHAIAVMDGANDPRGVGTLMHAHTGHGETLHEWFADYDEARARLEAASDRRYLLGFKKHYFLANEDFVRGLGVDPHDEAWRAIGFDWARPPDPSARRKLIGLRLAATRVSTG